MALSNEITERELIELKFICKQHIPVGVLERIQRPLELFDELENRNLLSPDNKEFWVVPHVPKVEIVNHSYIES